MIGLKFNKGYEKVMIVHGSVSLISCYLLILDPVILKKSDLPLPNMSRKLDVITLENLHAGVMDVKNCVNDILQKLNIFQQRVHTLEMENSNLKHEKT